MAKDKAVLTTFLVKFVGIDNIHLDTNDRIFVRIGSSKTKMYSILDHHVFFEREVFMRHSVITDGKKPKILLPKRDIITVFRVTRRKKVFFHRRPTKVGGCTLNYKDFLFTGKALLGFQLGDERRHVSLPVLRFTIESIWCDPVPQASIQESFIKRHWMNHKLRMDGLNLSERLDLGKVRVHS